jgi:hypothetical protein
MNGVPKAQSRAGSRRKGSVLSPFPGSSQARRQAAAILEVLAGELRPSEAAQALEVSLPRYYQLERRALTGLLGACEPPERGPRMDMNRRIAALERDNRRLERERDRQQALVRAAERSLGLALPTATRSSAKEKQPLQGSNGARRKRLRRPTVRALKAARTLRVETATATPEEVAGAATPPHGPAESVK